MTQEKFCSDCPESDSCKTVYEQLGKATGPPVALRAVMVFLVPIVVFIVSLAILQNVLAKSLSNENLQLALSFILALGIAFLYVLIIKAVYSYLAKGSNSCQLKGEDKLTPKVK